MAALRNLENGTIHEHCKALLFEFSKEFGVRHFSDFVSHFFKTSILQLGYSVNNPNERPVELPTVERIAETYAELSEFYFAMARVGAWKVREDGAAAGELYVTLFFFFVFFTITRRPALLFPPQIHIQM